MQHQQLQETIDKCEHEIAFTHASLCQAAQSLGTSTKERAYGNRAIYTALLLMISFLGIIIFFTFAWFLGLVLIILGIYFAFKYNSSASTRYVRPIENAQKTLNNIIDNNSKI